jgi:hypothetical protein
LYSTKHWPAYGLFLDDDVGAHCGGARLAAWVSEETTSVTPFFLQRAALALGLHTSASSKREAGGGRPTAWTSPVALHTAVI